MLYFESVFEIELSVLEEKCGKNVPGTVFVIQWFFCDIFSVYNGNNSQTKAIVPTKKKSNKVATFDVYWVVNGNFNVNKELFVSLYFDKNETRAELKSNFYALRGQSYVHVAHRKILEMIVISDSNIFSLFMKFGVISCYNGIAF